MTGLIESAQALVPRIYDAALDPGLWGSVLGDFTALVGGNRAALIRQNAATGVGQAVVSGFDASVMDDYFGYYGARNVLLPRLANVPLPSVLSDEDALPKDAFRGTEYYADFLSRRLDVNAVLLGVLWRDRRDVAAINFCRAPAAGEFEAEERQALELLAPHLQRALAVSLRLGALDVTARTAAQLLHATAYAALVADAQGRVRFANRSGEELLATGDAVAASPEGLRAASSEATARLRALLARAAAGDDGGWLVLPRADPARPLYAVVIPLGPEQAWLHAPVGRALVLLRDPAAERTLAEDGLQTLFGLTPAEARLASALHRLGSLAAATAELGVSAHTARAHLNAVLEKTATHRQAELALLLSRLEDVLVKPA